ncbi:hypothetical protein GQ43DRAFT_363773 [Delitschia confertaspora ATCC 74209]|uniref:Mediator of RNA polymerase II transcription subunit 17 n=1 Tax=Delitschia confertaspora ATCC 74209 TaxID=1513339 RepID=A0A9P4JUV6_9PLEO|nr:hypothetical protein GQ43DRAFT_363773 [Delitschia confertaspora ATCC 74209]
MAGTDSTTQVALTAWPVPENEDLSPAEIAQQLYLLGVQRGNFRNITEDALQNEIETHVLIQEDAQGQHEEGHDKKPQNKKERLKEIDEIKQKMSMELTNALFYARAGLDLIALALSKGNPRVTDQFLSPPIKQLNVPREAFGLASAREEEVGPTEERKREILAKGTRMKALESSANNILKAAMQLETEVRKETKYWDQVLSISEKGWALRRLRRDVKHSPLAVRYGYTEVSDHFRHREIAPLRMGEDGSIMLDPALTQRPKTIRVRISEDGNITGASSLPRLDEALDQPIEKLIQLARDSLFEEEIYYEISMETRQLLSHGVELRNSIVHLPAPKFGNRSVSRTILIDCVDRVEQLSQSSNNSQDSLARNVAEALRILLSHEHRMRLHRRSRIPPPLSQRKQQTPPPPLLRTILSCFQHLSAVDALKGYLGRTLRTLSSAGLEVPIQITYEATWAILSKVVTEASRKEFSAMDRLLDGFTRPFDSIVALMLPSSEIGQHEKLTIATRTSLGHPIYGSEYKVTIPSSVASILLLPQESKREFKFSNFTELIAYIDWILSLDLSHNFMSRITPRFVGVDQESRCTVLIMKRKKQVRKEMIAQFSDGSLQVTLISDDPPAQAEYVWDGTGGQESFKARVMAFLKAN